MVLIGVSLLPSLIVNLLASLILPARYNIRPIMLTFTSIVLALISALLLNLELIGGLFSVPATVIKLSVTWSVILLTFNAIIKDLLRTNK